MICYTIKHYTEAKENYKNIPMKVVNSKRFYLVNGSWINETLFNQSYSEPEYVKFNDKGAAVGSFLNLKNINQ